MEITFHSLDEIQAFMEFAGYEKRDVGVEMCRALAEPFEREAMQHVSVAAPIMTHTLPAANSTTPLEAEPEAAKRKRRTKAEIEADKRAAEEAATQSVQAGPQSAHWPWPSPKPSRTPFAADAASMAANIQTMMGGEVIAPSALAAAAHAEQPATEVAHIAHVPIADPAVWISQRAAEIGTVKQGEHLKICRNFISKFSLPKYNESFDLAGLTPNVMQYTPEQCALHQATLEFMSQPDASATTA